MATTRSCPPDAARGFRRQALLGPRGPACADAGRPPRRLLRCLEWRPRAPPLMQGRPAQHRTQQGRGRMLRALSRSRCLARRTGVAASPGLQGTWCRWCSPLLLSRARCPTLHSLVGACQAGRPSSNRCRHSVLSERGGAQSQRAPAGAVTPPVRAPTWASMWSLSGARAEPRAAPAQALAGKQGRPPRALGPTLEQRRPGPRAQAGFPAPALTWVRGARACQQCPPSATSGSDTEGPRRRAASPLYVMHVMRHAFVRAGLMADCTTATAWRVLDSYVG